MLGCAVLPFFSNPLLGNTVDEWTPGYQSLKFKRRNNFWSQADFVLFDGTITTSPPGTKTYDRRIQGTYNVGGDYALPNGGLRFSVKAFASYEKEDKDVAPKNPRTQFIKRIQPALDFTFVNPKGLEIFIGSQLHHEFAYDSLTQSDFVDSINEKSAVTMNVLRFGMMRRGGSWNGGFYYINGAETQRDIKQYAVGFQDQSIVTKERVQVPPEAGIIASFRFYGFESELDLALVQASEAPDVSSDGISVVDDYLRIRLGTYFPVLIGSIGLSLTHKTLSYSSNAFVNLETIPTTVAKARLLLGTLDSNVYVGGVYGLGDDGLSIPETNETYKLRTIGFTTGVFLAL